MVKGIVVPMLAVASAKFAQADGPRKRGDKDARFKGFSPALASKAEAQLDMVELVRYAFTNFSEAEFMQ